MKRNSMQSLALQIFLAATYGAISISAFAGDDGPPVVPEVPTGNLTPPGKGEFIKGIYQSPRMNADGSLITWPFLIGDGEIDPKTEEFVKLDPIGDAVAFVPGAEECSQAPGLVNQLFRGPVLNSSDGLGVSSTPIRPTFASVVTNGEAVGFWAAYVPDVFTCDPLNPSPFPQTPVGLWAFRNNQLELIAHEGMTAPGPDGMPLSGITFTRPRLSGTTFPQSSEMMGPDVLLAMNVEGKVAFRSFIISSQSVAGEGIWAEDSQGMLRLVARDGDLFPGSQQATMAAFGPPSINSAGDVVFHATDSNGLVEAVVKYNFSTGGTTIAHTGMIVQAPLLESMFSQTFGFGNFRPHDDLPIAINESGVVAFRAELGPPIPVEGNRVSSIWIFDDGQLSLYAHDFMEASGVNEMVVFGGTPPEGGDCEFVTGVAVPAINNSGAIAFTATWRDPEPLSASEGQGIFFSPSLEEPAVLVVRNGDPAGNLVYNAGSAMEPMFVPVTIRHFAYSLGCDQNNGSGIQTLSLNELNQIAFGAVITPIPSGPHGIPSVNTIADALMVIDPDAFDEKDNPVGPHLIIHKHGFYSLPDVDDPQLIAAFQAGIGGSHPSGHGVFGVDEENSEGLLVFSASTHETFGNPGIDRQPLGVFVSRFPKATPKPECPGLCEGDLTGSGTVGSQDLGMLLACLGPDPEGMCLCADLNGDGVVNSQDTGILLGRWGPCP